MAAAQSPAAVVRPLTRLSRVTMIVPAPMKPMPEMTCAPRRATSVNRCRESSRYWLVSVVMAAPRQMRMCVRKPAGRRFVSRSAAADDGQRQPDENGPEGQGADGVKTMQHGTASFLRSLR